MQTILCPAQSEARKGVAHAMTLAPLVVLWGRVGSGKTTVLQDLHREMGGAMVTTADFVGAMVGEPDPMRLEETFYNLLFTALDSHDTVFFDDLASLTSVVGDCNRHYPRRSFLDSPLTALCDMVIQLNKRLVFVSGGGAGTPDPLEARCYPFGIGKFTPEDYRCIIGNYLDSSAMDRLDISRLHRFAPKLNAYQLKNACLWLRQLSELDTELFTRYLRSQSLGSNVELSEVQEVDLHDLKGIDDLIEALEANIIVPLESVTLAEELDIKPKRGVLLAGPPGTGKTTIGRALAHRLRSKFFLIDGTFISGTRDFYQKVHYVFEAAKNNAPSIIFIDDSDVIFETGEEMGLYRYLLTMLDGLESESAGRVCVMMTAMDVGKLPPALVRSGRVELWLETRYPDENARCAILETQATGLPSRIGTLDLQRLVEDSEGLTGADLKRVIEDGKLLFAYDQARGRRQKEGTEYFLRAIETVRANKLLYAEAEKRARQQMASRSPRLGMMQQMASATIMRQMGTEHE